MAVRRAAITVFAGLASFTACASDQSPSAGKAFLPARNRTTLSAANNRSSQASAQQSLAATAVRASSLADWSTIGDQIRDQTWDWENADGTTTDLTVLGNALSATFSLIGAFQGIASGASWDDTMLALGGAVLPFISMANPFLGLACGLFMSFFHSSENLDDQLAQILSDLYDQIMHDVQNLITETLADEAYKKAKFDVTGIANYLFDNPTLSLTQLQGLDQKFYMDHFGSVFYGTECVNDAQDGPAEEPSEQCIIFQRQGALTFQLSFVSLHLNVLLEIARLSPEDEREWRLSVVVRKADLYSRLLRASLDSWKLHSEDVIPQIEYVYPKYWGEHSSAPRAYLYMSWCPGCSKPVECSLQLAESSKLDPYSGANIAEQMGCTPEYTYCEYDDRTRYDHSYEGQYTFGSRRRSKMVSYPAGMCSDVHYTSYVEQYRLKLEDAYGPSILEMSRVALVV